ncbi:hypothetical protein Scep_010954 [Stephania cephalantha]|uniref:PORR domain-containing protein n=1 Tax=Stephania cephalantha TaxID=152367 RepID=A0AAP0JXF2_9MAGN
MLFGRNRLSKLKNLVLSPLRPLQLYEEQSHYSYNQVFYYVDVTMKWKKDRFYDSIEVVNKSRELKSLIALKNCITAESDGCMPISAVSKRGYELDVTTKKDIVDRLKKLILMTKEKRLPLKIIRGLQWYLGLPDEFLKKSNTKLDESFKFVEMEDGLIGLSVDTDERMLSQLQKNAVKTGGYDFQEGSSAPLAFPLFPSKGLRLKRKISNWLDMFQNLPYVSPYEDSSHLDPCSDVSEKRVAGVLHELLSIFVDHSAERKKLFCLRTHLGLPQKFYKAFQRHPHVFYLSLMDKTCTAILKEAYNDDSAVEVHPILHVRKKYIKLMKDSNAILKSRKQNNQSVQVDNFSLDVDMDCEVGNNGLDSNFLCK